MTFPSHSPLERSPARSCAKTPASFWLAMGCCLLLGGCGWLGLGGNDAGTTGGDAAASEPGTEGAEAEAAGEGQPQGPFADGVLQLTVSLAPAGSNSQYLAEIADKLGWETEVAQDVSLKKAVQEGDFPERVEPRMLGLFFRMGYSVLPRPGEGHEFNRDSVVRGDVANSRYLVRSREEVHIIFLGFAENIVIIYPKEGKQPQIFNRHEASTVAVRESRLKNYLN